MSMLNKIRYNDEDLWMSMTTAIPRPRPIAPTLLLPPLRKLNDSSKDQIKSSLRNLRLIYFPPPPHSLGVKPASGTEPKYKHNHQQQKQEGENRMPLSPPPNLSNLDTEFIKLKDDHDAASVAPDSGYASAEEGEDEDVPQSLDFDWIRADSCERDFAIKWVVGLIARSDVWMSMEEEESEEEQRLLDEAVEMLDAFRKVGDDGEAEDGDKGKEEEGGALVREFVFPLCSPSTLGKPSGEARREIHVRLNDLSPSQNDHTSVGLQSWGSCIILAERICADPERFLNTPVATTLSGSNLNPLEAERKIRILELGAGTGMLSIVCAKTLRDWNVDGEVMATDYHPDVLRNLEGNVKLNFEGKGNAKITISYLDWEYPSSYDTNFDGGSFDIILAADVIYHPQHASWIKGVVARLLAKPLPCDCDCGGVCSASAGLGGGTFWLFIPVRTTGRHEGMADTVSELFPSVKLGMGLPMMSTRLELAIVDSEEMLRRDGVGRADEIRYQLYQIKWVPMCG